MTEVCVPKRSSEMPPEGTSSEVPSLGQPRGPSLEANRERLSASKYCTLGELEVKSEKGASAADDDADEFIRRRRLLPLPRDKSVSVEEIGAADKTMRFSLLFIFAGGKWPLPPTVMPTSGMIAGLMMVTLLRIAPDPDASLSREAMKTGVVLGEEIEVVAAFSSSDPAANGEGPVAPPPF